MADPVITIHDSLGAEITEGTPVVLPTATPGTPTAETVLSIRNNDAGGGAVDPARNVLLTVLGRLAGSAADPTADGLNFLVSRALQVRVSAVSGGATSPVTSWRPLGVNRTLDLGEIPDGGIVTIGVRCRAALAAALADVEVFLSVDSIQSTALPDGAYGIAGNFIYDGRPGGTADPDFSEIYSETGSWAVSGPPDADVNTPTAAVYALAGVWESYAGTSITFTNLDGDAAALVAGEAYYAAVTYAGGGTLTVTKGSKATTPLTDADKPTPPAGEILRLWVVVPFGLAIDTIELVGEVGFFNVSVVSGLQIQIGPGQGAVGGRWVRDQTPNLVTVTDDDTSIVYRLPESGIESVASAGTVTDGQAMALWSVTAVAGAITATVDLRQIGLGDSVLTIDRVQGFLGIGTAPSVKLDVLGSAVIEGAVVIKGPAANASFDIQSNDGHSWRFRAIQSGGAFNLFEVGGNTVIVVESGGITSQLHIDSSGNTGIGGQTTPAEALDVTGNIKASGTVEGPTGVIANGTTNHGALATAPAFPSAGDTYYDTGLNQWGYWNTSIWVYW